MAANEEAEISFQQDHTNNPEPPGDLTSFQFVPEKIVDFSISQDGQRSYRVRWKDSWLTEELLAITYQHLINDFWSNNLTKEKKAKNPAPLKLMNKSDHFPDFAPAANITLQKAPVDNTTVDTITGDNLLEDSSLLKSHTMLGKDQTNSSITPLVVNGDLNNLQYQDIDPAMLTAQPIPKYQQALQQQLSVQPQQLAQDAEGKVTFPKHVFSQARYLNKTQQKQIADADSQRVQCDICNRSLKTKKMLWAHKVAVHFGGNFPCDLCGKKCITGAELRRHMTSHSTERKFVCQYCGLAYKRWSHLYQHLRIHEVEKNFRCDVCHVNFKVQSELKDHCFAEHNNGEMVQCSVCRHKLQTPLAVYHHSMKHTGTRDFICQICSSTFKRKQHLVTHMKTHLTETALDDGSSEVFNCQACDESFSLKMELKAHCDSAHPLHGNESVYCKTCQRKLKVTHSVYLHGLRHCGVREFECGDCNQKFKRKAHLLRHQQDRHPSEPRERKKRGTNMGTTVCSICRKAFKYKTVLIKHMAAQHGIIPKADGTFEPGVVYKPTKKPFPCEHCTKRFKTKELLEEHTLQHGLEISENNTTVQEEDPTSDDKTSDDMDMSVKESPKSNEKDSPVVSASMVLNYTAPESSGSSQDMSQGSSQPKSQEGEYKMGENPLMGARILTVDQETGQLYLVGGEAGKSTQPPENNSDTAINNQAIAQQSEAATQQYQPSLQQHVPLGQIMSQDGVALSSVPLQLSTDGNNLLQFSQGSSEQILVLLSTLSQQSMQQMQ